jgi:hypothetical protein
LIAVLFSTLALCCAQPASASTPAHRQVGDIRSYSKPDYTVQVKDVDGGDVVHVLENGVQVYKWERPVTFLHSLSDGVITLNDPSVTSMFSFVIEHGAGSGLSLIILAKVNGKWSTLGDIFNITAAVATPFEYADLNEDGNMEILATEKFVGKVNVPNKRKTLVGVYGWDKRKKRYVKWYTCRYDERFRLRRH